MTFRWNCIAAGRLREISQVVQNACGVMADEDVTFTRLEIGPFHDDYNAKVHPMPGQTISVTKCLNPAGLTR